MIERRAARHFDYGLVLLAAALVVYGGLLIYSASLTAYPDGIAGLSHPVVRQAMFAVFGLAMMGIVAWMDYRMFGQMAPALYALAILILVVVLFLGDSAFGSRRWITIGDTQIQASEVAKLLSIVALARYLADRQLQIRQLRVFLTSLGLAVLPAALVMAEPDMGTAIIFGAVWAGMVLAAGARVRHMLMLAGFLLAAIPFAALAVLGDYQRERSSSTPTRTRWAAASTSFKAKSASAPAASSARGSPTAARPSSTSSRRPPRTTSSASSARSWGSSAP